MRKLVILLAFTSAAFAASTLYYASELSRERERQASLIAPQNDTAPQATGFANALPASSTGSPGTPDKPAAQAPTAASSALMRTDPMSEEEMKQAQADYSNRFLAQLADPQGREELLNERKVMMRNSYPRVAQYLGLTSEEYNRFLELSARQQIDMQELHSKCSLAPDCNMQESFRNAALSGEDQIRELLGAERAQKFATYKNTMGEREAVTQLRTRLPDAQRLSDDKAESLVTALAEEREAMHREAAQRGNGMSGFGVGAGMIFSSNDGRPLEERYEEARQYSQRLRDRAAQVLTGDQLRAFNEMQDETLLGLRSMLRNKDANGGYSTVTIAQ